MGPDRRPRRKLYEEEAGSLVAWFDAVSATDAAIAADNDNRSDAVGTEEDGAEAAEFVVDEFRLVW